MTQRKRILEQTVAAMQLRYGPAALKRASVKPVAVLPSGIAPLDRALAGGFPCGRFSELLGRGSAGQFTVAARVLAQAQQAGQMAAYYVDVDAAVDVEALVRCGVRLDLLAILRPHGLGHALTMTDDLLRMGSLGAVVFDRLDYPLLLADRGVLKRLECALRNWTPLLSRSQSVFLFITETPPLPCACPEGLPLASFASIRLAFEHQAWLSRGSRVVGFASRVTVLKNKSGPSGQTVSLRFLVT